MLKKQRESNLELYRIIVMLLIVAHHYVVNSGLFEALEVEEKTPSALAMVIFGGWGKTGINCFVLITGWFMCRSRFTWGKFLKLYLQIILYTLIIYGIFCISGHQHFHVKEAILLLLPVKNMADDFTSCFMVFYLLIPFLNIFIEKINQRQHLGLLVLLLFIYTLLPTFLPSYFRLNFNYTEWFIFLYLLASYIRFYNIGKKISHRQWGWLMLVSVTIASISIIALFSMFKSGFIHYNISYFFISDSNKLLALIISVSSFMWFKDLKISYSKFINAIGGATFGVLLIHANSNTMRQWLWKETVDCVGHFGDSLLWTLSYAILTVLVIFIVCAGIDWFRGLYVEPHLLKTIYRIGNKYKCRWMSKHENEEISNSTII